MQARVKSRVVICLLLLFVMLFSAAAFMVCAEHDCAGSCCALCRVLEDGEELLRSTLLITVVLPFLTGAFFALLAMGLFALFSVAPTLVDRKVKLTD